MHVEHLLEHYDEETIIRECEKISREYIKLYKEVYGSLKNEELDGISDPKLQKVLARKNKKEMCRFIEKRLGEIRVLPTNG